ncbi:MAG TPA: ABC transporter ATP-binding protein [Pyrinomonadaceae bacterium]|nr:ABC transporter ATP-binding protein [Pyrinomonadaceae bacterium]
MLEVGNISVAFGSRTIIDDISLVLREGEIVALLGPNGAGKTTLLRSLNGTVPLKSGTIALNGISLHDLSRREIAKNIAVVAQENETKFPVTVLAFVLAGRFTRGAAFGWETSADIKSALDALEMCDLDGFSGRLMNELSGGERQRVVLARALAAETAILLLDEPTANLDLAHQGLMFRLVRDRCRNSKGAAIVITHDLNLASEFADRVLLLKSGKVFARGAAPKVLTSENLREVYNVQVLLDENPASGKVRVTTVY